MLTLNMSTFKKSVKVRILNVQLNKYNNCAQCKCCNTSYFLFDKQYCSTRDYIQLSDNRFGV